MAFGLAAAGFGAPTIVSDEAGLDAALAGRASEVVFAGDASITITMTKVIAADLTLDGNGHSVTLSGGNVLRVFTVGAGVHLTLRNLTIANGGGVTFGGGLYNSGGTVTLTDCTFSHNAVSGGANGGAGAGGAIYNESGAWLQLINCTFDSNSAAGGAGVAGNSGGYNGGPGGTGYGGGIFNNGGVISLLNCTFSGNQATGGTGGAGGRGVDGYQYWHSVSWPGTGYWVTVYGGPGGRGGDGGNGYGGSLYNFSGSVTLSSVTLARGVAGGGWGGSPGNPGLYASGNYGSGSAGTNSLGGNIAVSSGGVYLRNTIIAYGSGSPGNNCAGTLVDAGGNLCADATAGLSLLSSRNSVDPLLAAALASNGGATATLALASQSPAIDAGDSSAPATDQRHFARDNRGDIGAYEFQQYSYVTNADGTVTLTGYSGTGGTVTLPTSIGGLSVTGIGSNAFYNNANLVSVTIPGGVTDIGDGAFFGCSALRSVAVPASVAHIGVWAFARCGGLDAINMDPGNPAFASVAGVLFTQDLTTVLQFPSGKSGVYAIPAGVISVGNQAFAFCPGLTGVTMPEGVRYIGLQSFYSCGNLTTISIPDSVVGIGNGAFDSCTGLVGVAIGSHVASLGAAAFQNCSSLLRVTMGGGVTNIGSMAFSACTALTGVYFTGPAPTLGLGVFDNDSNATIYYLDQTAGWGPAFGGRPAVMLAPPSISARPANLTVNSGATATFSVVATGTSPLGYVWQKDGAAIPGATGATYSIPSAQPADAGTYTVVVTNSVGSTASEGATLTVVVPKPPTISSAPATRQVLVAGQSASFPITADGTGPFTYQWRHNGFVIATATTGTLSLAKIVPADRGYYQVAVTNSAGTARAVFFVNVAVSHAAVAAWGDTSFGQNSVPGGLTEVVAVASGSSHCLALSADGTVAAWGGNFSGQCNVPAGLGAVVAIAAGGNQSLALKEDGTVVAWGGSGVPDGLAGVVAIAAGNMHNLALKADGTVVAWGYNSFGQASVPDGLSDVVAVAAGDAHSMALKADGTVVGWGYNYSGQFNVPATLTSAVAIAAGGSHCLAVKADGTVVGWGYNNYGQISVPGGLAGVVGIAGGSGHSLALKADGTLTTWGWNYYGQQIVPSNLDGVVQVSAGGGNSLALFAPSAPTITSQPSSQTVDAGATVNFTVVAGGTAPFAYQWKRNGAILMDGGGVSGAITPTLTLSAVSIANAGSYTVMVNNAVGGVASDAAVLTVVRRTQTISFDALSDVLPGTAPFTLGATASSGLPVSYTSSNPAVATVSGATVTIVGLGSTTIAASQAGNATYLPAADVQRTLVVAGTSSATLVDDGFVGTVGSPPDPTRFEWGGQLAQTGSGQLGLSTDTANQSWLRSKAGAAPGPGETLVLQMRLAAYAEGWTPGIYGDGQPRGLRVGTDAGNVVEFYSVSSTSVGLRTRKGGAESLATYTLSGRVDAMHDYEIAVTASSAVFKVDGVIAGTLTTNIPMGVLNAYVATFDGYAGNVPVTIESLSLTLTGRLAAVAPTIAVQPGDAVVWAASDAVFSVTASGTAPFSYLWRASTDNGLTWADLVDSGVCHGSTLPTLTLPDAMPSLNGGRYQCVVTNGAGSVTSGTARLTVNVDFDFWLVTHFTTEELADPGKSGPNAVYGEDGLGNLIKYALGLNPKVNVTAGLPAVSATATDWVYTYNRPGDRVDLSYGVEMSTNLTTWTDVGVTHQMVSSSEGIETWEGRVPLASAPIVFFRLKIVR